MKKLLSVLMAAILLASLIFSGCSSSTYNSESNDSFDEYEVCFYCEGTGSQTCTYCEGTGVMSAAGTTYTCPTCSGTGIRDCYRCSGAGVLDKGGSDSDNNGNGGGNIIYDTPIIDDGGYGGTTCPRCSGAGSMTCSSCHGTGESYKTQYAPDFGNGGGGAYQISSTCTMCNGSGTINCTLCFGTGTI